MINRTILILLLSFMLAGCAANLQPKAVIDASADLPGHFSGNGHGAERPQQWWDNFDSPELSALIEAAIHGNFSLQEAWARLEQAEIAARKEGAQLYPKLDYQADSSYREQKVSGLARSKNDDWALGLTASYEIDLWGRIAADKNSLSLGANASKEDLKAAMITVSGEIAETWISQISAKNQQELFFKQRELQGKLLELIKFRFPVGKSSALDIYQQQQAIERITAALIPLKSRENLLKRKMALLIGKASADDLLLSQNVFPAHKEVPAIGLPVDLLAARPDILAASLRLNAAQWQTTAAKADRLPAIRLSASHKYSSNDIAAVFDNWILNLAGSLAGPIFDGGRRKLEVARTEAVSDERLATYRKVVFNAVKEVEDALADEQQYLQTEVSLEKQLRLSAKTMQEAKTRYINGSSDFINVLREELNNLQLQQDMIIAKEKMFIARVNLHKALGGSWVNTFAQ